MFDSTPPTDHLTDLCHSITVLLSLSDNIVRSG